MLCRNTSFLNLLAINTNFALYIIKITFGTTFLLNKKKALLCFTKETEVIFNEYKINLLIEKKTVKA